MAKADAKKETAKPKNKQEQYERFQKTARDLGIDDESAKAFETIFKRIVPPKPTNQR